MDVTLAQASQHLHRAPVASLLLLATVGLSLLAWKVWPALHQLW